MSAEAIPEVPPAVLERLAGGRVGRLATRGRDDRPDIVPITFALVGGGADARLVTAVDHKPKSTRRLHRLDRIRRHPTVSVLVDHYDDADWDELWWVRVTGPAAILDLETPPPAGTGSDAAAMIDALVAKYPQYRDVRPEGPVIVVTPTTWQWWSASDRTGLDPRQEHP